MLKFDFFLNAMKAGLYKRKAFVISAFALIREAPEDWKADPYPYRIVQTMTGHYFVDPDDTTKLISIDGTKAGEPPFAVREVILLDGTQGIVGIPNKAPPAESTYGGLLFNYIAIIHPFAGKIPYQFGKVSPKGVEALIIVKLKDNPKTEEERNSTDIYVDEYLKFCDSMFSLTGFTQLCVPATTRKTITAAPGILDLKKKLLKENADRLSDPAVIAKIDAELVAYDRAWMKGDEGEGFLITDKSFKLVRKRLYAMHGAEAGLGDGLDVELIQNSLSEGWDVNQFPAINNAMRAGSFNRGAETMLGGESVKWLFRASSNINIMPGDCKTKLGNIVKVTVDNIGWFIGFNIVKDNGVEMIADADAAMKYIGKELTVRSPMYCKLDKTDYCECCVGARLAGSPTSAAVAVADYGSTFMSMSMQAMHGKEMSVAVVDLISAIQ